MRVLKLMADYQCFPLWEASPGVVGNINPSDLPITELLQSRLMAWAEEFDKTLDMDDPAKSGFRTPQAQENFIKSGVELGQQLQDELGPEYSVLLKV